MPQIPARPRKDVADRVGRRCEYCLISELHSFARYQFEHVIPLKHGGETALDNLALCCDLCNRRKGRDLSSLDHATGELAPLFHPRRARWNQHFEFRGGEIFPLSLLRLNRPDRVKERELLIRNGWLGIRD